MTVQSDMNSTILTKLLRLSRWAEIELDGTPHDVGW